MKASSYSKTLSFSTARTLSPTLVDLHAPLRRSLPGSRATKRRWPAALLALAGLALLVDIEFGLAYVLYFAARLVG
jgi:hypothetical protein